MKMQKQNRQGLCLQRRNKRWKWMAGATAATAAGVGASQAALITVNLTNNYISATGGNHLNADLTGDGRPDLTIANAFYAVDYPFTTYGIPNPYYGNLTARVNLNGILASAHRFNFGAPFSGTERLGSRVTGFYRFPPYFYGTYSLTGSIPLHFNDLHINGGARTSGLLQVTVSTRGLHNAKVRLDGFTYNTHIPDGESSLALLAMGAGGILALRRWRAAQGRSSN
jgi:hypothetical protein